MGSAARSSFVTRPRSFFVLPTNSAGEGVEWSAASIWGLDIPKHGYGEVAPPEAGRKVDEAPTAAPRVDEAPTAAPRVDEAPTAAPTLIKGGLGLRAAGLRAARLLRAPCMAWMADGLR